MAPRDCVPALDYHGLYDMAVWASARPVRHGWRGRTCRDLWDAGPRGDWLLDWATMAGADRRDLARATAACVRPALRFVPAGEDRPRLALEAAERWADEPTEENMVGARHAAGSAWKARDVQQTLASRNAANAAGTVAGGAGWEAGAGGPPDSWWQDAVYESFSYEHPMARWNSACADAVRRLVPFLDLSAGGAR